MTKTDLGLARDVLGGKKVEPINFVPLFAVDKNSLASFDPPEW